jgi:hypothetical protein
MALEEIQPRRRVPQERFDVNGDVLGRERDRRLVGGDVPVRR